METVELAPKKGSGRKNWQFFWFNYDTSYIDETIVPMFQSFGCLAFAMQEEICPSTKKPHIQGYVKFKTKKRWSQFKLTDKISWLNKTQKGTDYDCLMYCTKPESRKEDGKQWTFGFKRPKQLQLVTKTMLRKWQLKIANKFDKPPDMFCRKVYWYYEEKGGFGKSILAKYFVDQRNACVFSGKASDIFNGMRTFIEKNNEGPDIVILDVPRCNLSYISYQAIEKIKDGLLYSGKYEGGQLRFNTPHLIVFANEEPDRSALSEDRWRIHKLNKAPR